MARMIARTTARPTAAYRVGDGYGGVPAVTRRTWIGAGLLVTLVVVAFVAIRFVRSLGPLGIVAPIVVVGVFLWVLHDFGLWRMPSRPSAPSLGPRNVTPPEASNPKGSPIAPRPRSHPVLIVEPAPAAETLETKLATLDRLRDDGRLTDAEYEAKRAQLIADF
jgi:hypothetical protein